jgi:anti-sigma regulatory factor (Ser/Thr protein kinase)
MASEELEITIHNREDYKVYRQQVSHFIRSVIHKDFYMVEVAVNEAINNALLHGHKDHTHGEITVNLKVQNDHLIMKVTDEGNGFQVKEQLEKVEKLAVNPAKEMLWNESGRGILIMKHAADEVKFNPKGNEVTLIKAIKRST